MIKAAPWLALGLFALTGLNWLQHSEPLCINGHPAPRSPDVTYAGLPPRHGYERDHIVPLCLAGSDTRDNLQYQPIDEARKKDSREWHACEQFCRGEITLDEARSQFHREWP